MKCRPMNRNNMQDFRREQFKEITKHLIQDKRPSEYIQLLSEDSNYSEAPFNMLWLLKSTEQSKKYHPEGSVWKHTMLVLDEAAKVRSKSSDPLVFMWAALLHDIGKPEATKIRKGKITSYDHDKIGEKLCVKFLMYFTQNEEFIQKVASLVRYHMHMLYVLRDLPYSDVANLIHKVDINEIALLCLCDRMGRYGAVIASEEMEYNIFIKKLKQVKNELDKNR